LFKGIILARIIPKDLGSLESPGDDVVNGPDASIPDLLAWKSDIKIQSKINCKSKGPPPFSYPCGSLDGKA
jgi:hypothetical protein